MKIGNTTIAAINRAYSLKNPTPLCHHSGLSVKSGCGTLHLEVFTEFMLLHDLREACQGPACTWLSCVSQNRLSCRPVARPQKLSAWFSFCSGCFPGPEVLRLLSPFPLCTSLQKSSQLLKNSFTEVQLMYKELQIFSMSSLMSLDKCKHPWFHHHHS